MGYVFGDLIIEQLLRTGLADLQGANINTRLADIYSQLKDSFLTTEYGQQELDRYKYFLQNNKIDIVQSHRMIEPRMPCISILVQNNTEDLAKTTLGDFSGYQDTISGGEITDRREVYEIPIRDTIQVGVHVADPHGFVALRWLYTSVLYILISYKDILISKGMDLSTFNSSDVNRIDEYLPENVFSRYISFSYLNYFSWKSRTADLIIDNVDLNGGIGGSDPGAQLGGVKVESGQNTDYEEGSFFTIDPTV